MSGLMKGGLTRSNTFLKLTRINTPLRISRHNIIDLKDLMRICTMCESIHMGYVYRVVFLVDYFGLLRLSNIAPHSYNSFCHTRHISAGDVIFDKKIVKIIIKWSKAVQTRDKVHVLSFPRLQASILWPYKALKKVFSSYSPSQDQPLFQIAMPSGLQVLIDSKIRKVLSRLNLKLDYPKKYYTFHIFWGLFGL